MKIEFDLEVVDRPGGKTVEVSITCGDRSQVIYAEWPNPEYHGGAEGAAFSLVARRFEEALQELSLERR